MLEGDVTWLIVQINFCFYDRFNISKQSYIDFLVHIIVGYKLKKKQNIVMASWIIRYNCTRTFKAITGIVLEF